MQAVLVGAVVHFFAIPLFAWLSDRIGRRPVYAFGGLAPCRLQLRILPDALKRKRHGGLCGGHHRFGAARGMSGPEAAMKLFSTPIRHSGAWLAYQLTSIVAGSLAPIIALAIYQRTGSAVPVAIYAAVACAISGVTALLARETKGVELAAIR